MTEAQFIACLGALTDRVADAKKRGIPETVDHALCLLLAIEGAFRAGESEALFQALMPGVVAMRDVIKKGLNSQ